MPDVSVVICTFNRERLLRQALESFLKQDGLAAINWELLVVDNNSQDRTAEAVNAFSDRFYGRLKYVFETRQGLNIARNRGIAESRAPFIAFSDDDVQFGRTWLKALYEGLRDHRADAVGGNVLPLWQCPCPSWFVSEGPHRMAGVLVERDFGKSARPIQNGEALPIGANMAFRRETFERYGSFDEGIGCRGASLASRVGDDTEFFIRLLARQAKVLFVPGMEVVHPVPEERFNKALLRRWHFNYGRSEILIRKPDAPRRFLGVYFYLYKAAFQLASQYLFYLVTLRWKIAFSMQLKLLKTLGAIWECLWKEKTNAKS